MCEGWLRSMSSTVLGQRHVGQREPVMVSLSGMHGNGQMASDAQYLESAEV